MIKKLAKIFIISLLFSVASTTLYAQDSIQVDLEIGGCNNNGICEIDESVLSCPSDCTLPPPPPPGGGGVPPMNNIYIKDLTIEPDFTTATIRWNSTIGTISTVHWGETTEVKEGTLSSVIFKINHKVELINLKPGTMYFFVIDSKDNAGKNLVHPVTFFFTKFLKDTTLPANPTNVRASSSISGIKLTWKNPQEENFSYIRIMRHEDRFRGNPFLGKLIYEGREELFLDTDVIEGKKYFYSLFSRDEDGNFSSGVAVSATAYSEKIIPPEIIPPEIVPPEVIPPEVIPPEKDIDLSAVPLYENFFVYQYNKLVEPLLKDKIIEIDGDKSTIVDTVKKTFPDDLIQVTDETGKIVGQFLFSYNADSGRYQGVIPPLENKGIYNVKVYRYKNEMPIIISEGFLKISEKAQVEVIEECNTFFMRYKLPLDLIFILILMFGLYLVSRKNQEK